MKPIGPDELNRRITLRLSTVSDNGFGESIPVWIDGATVWAKRVELYGNERWAAQQTVDKVDAKYHIRYRRDVTPTMRFKEGLVEYDIKAVNELGFKEWLELVVSKVGN